MDPSSQPSKGKNTAPAPESTCDRAISGRSSSRTFKRELDFSRPPPEASSSTSCGRQLPACQLGGVAPGGRYDSWQSFELHQLAIHSAARIDQVLFVESKQESKRDKQNSSGKNFLSDADGRATRWLLTTDATMHQKISSNLISDPHARILVAARKRRGRASSHDGTCVCPATRRAHFIERKKRFLRHGRSGSWLHK